MWSEFETIQSDIDTLLPDPEENERTGFESVFFSVQSLARKKRLQCQNLTQTIPMSRETIDRAGSQNTSQARLPTISIPSFDGNYDKWQSFYDIFLVMVDKNNNLDAVTKFHYLQSALTGKAREYISSFEVTSQNYVIVLELLKKRYYNPQLIIKHHIHQLFNLSQVTRDSPNSLRALADGLQKHTRMLEQLDEPVDKWDTILVYLASNKLYGISKREWESKVVNKNLLKLAMGESLSSCVICKRDHRIYVCSQFRELSVDDKRNKVKELSLCFNCLGIKHTAA